MLRIRPATAAAALIAMLLVSSCGGTVADKYKIEHEPAHVETVAGSKYPRVVLEDRAMQRLAIETTTVVKQANALVVPSAAVFVDPKGAWWVYTNPETLVFVRHEIRVQREAGGLAYLSSGPPAGTRVATVGVTELYGIEEEVGH
jgi:hypothetical protein